MQLDESGLALFNRTDLKNRDMTEDRARPGQSKTCGVVTALIGRYVHFANAACYS